MFDFEDLPGGDSPQAPKPDDPNAKYKVGMLVESIGATIVREAEDLESPQAGRLRASSRVEVLDIGTGPTGKRIRVRALEGDLEGWVSVIAQNTAPLWREVAAAAGQEPAGASAQDTAEERRLEREKEARRAAAEEAAKQRKLEESRREEEARRREEEERRRVEEGPAVGRPTDRFSAGDVWRCTSSLCMRSEEDLSKSDNEVVGRIDAGSEVEVLEVGVCASGKRVRIRCEEADLEGWVSVVNTEGKELLSPLRTRSDLFAGAGQALGGGEGAAAVADPRAAALAAAERRQKGALAHGLGEKKAKELGEQGKREALLKKIGEAYAKRQEEVPLAIPSASLEALQRHFDQLASAPSPGASPKEASPKAASPKAAPAAQQTAAAIVEPPRAAARAVPAKASPPAPAPGRFEPPPRGSGGPEPPLHPAAVRVLEDMKANPGLDMLQETVLQRPLTFDPVVQDFLQEHAAAVALEPRLKAEIERLLCRGKPPPDRAGAAPLAAAPQEAAAPQAPKSPEEQRQLLMAEARGVCGLNDQQMKAVEELEALGFEYRAALEAFLACERSKELAANYLFENPPAAEATAAALPQRTFISKALPPAFPGKPPNEEDLRLSMDDMEAIQRIQELGFDRPTSLKAYVACKRDEEEAANRLLM